MGIHTGLSEPSTYGSHHHCRPRPDTDFSHGVRINRRLLCDYRTQVAASLDHGSGRDFGDRVCDCCSPESEVASESCCSEDSSAVVDSQGPSSPSSWYGFLLPWLTPIGGFALVAAHLLNRRHCRCCSSAVLCDSNDLDKDSPS